MRLLLRAEREALGDVARSALESVGGFLRTHGAAVTTAHELEGALVAPMLRARQRGRQASRAALREEFAVARSEAIAYGVDPYSLPLLLPDLGEANENSPPALAAREIATAFTSRALTRIGQAEGRGVTARSALPAHVIEEKAATQTAAAFAAHRTEAEQATVEQYAGHDWLPLILKVWDATLDRRTCGVCREMDGQTRPLGFSFDGNRVPALVHRRCRCIQALFFAPLYMGRRQAPATSSA